MGGVFGVFIDRNPLRQYRVGIHNPRLAEGCNARIGLGMVQILNL